MKNPYHKHVPWPLEQMVEWYESGYTLKEVAARLSSGEWQSYWLEHLGNEYHPSGDTVKSLFSRKNIPRRVGRASMEHNVFWKGGSYTDTRGYVYIRCPDHPIGAGAGGGYVQEHRLVMEKHLGRYLTKEEVVHHIDCNPGNNNVDNLMLFPTNAEHLAYELKGRCPDWTEEGYQRMLESAARKKKIKPDVPTLT